MKRLLKYSEWARPVLGIILTLLMVIFMRKKGLPMFVLYAAISFGMSYLIFYLIEKISKNKDSK